MADCGQYHEIRQGDVTILRTEPFLVLLTVLLLAQAASSKEEAVDLGPHRVTFSLPSSVECALTVAEPAEGRTPTGIDYIERSIDLDCGGGRASISLRAHQSPVPAGDGVVRALSKKTPRGIGVVGVETEARLVDRHTGYLTTFSLARGGEVYQAAYWLDRHLAPGDFMGSTYCVISSSLPWTATKELLDSIHLEVKEEAVGTSTVETVVVGPYLVYFDLGGLNYTVFTEGPDAGDPEPGAERYRAILASGQRRATIEIDGYEDYRMVNLETERLLAEAHLQAKGYTRNNGSVWTVGGEAGILGVGEDEDHQILFVAIFWPGQVEAGEGVLLARTRCEVESSFLWNATEIFLDSIRVERIEEV